MTDWTELLDKATALAEIAHRDQVDKAGKPYFGHPHRVMNAVDGEVEKIVGVLHDAVEDSPLTLEQLVSEGFPGAVIEAIDAVTKRDGEDYEAYLERVMSNRVALEIKIADMKDNMNLSRIPAPTEKDRKRLAKYERILPRLEKALKEWE